jgi:hypothetical protein
MAATPLVIAGAIGDIAFELKRGKNTCDIDLK